MSQAACRRAKSRWREAQKQRLLRRRGEESDSAEEERIELNHDEDIYGADRHE
ncbi:MAG: hypothetical protein U5L09_14345 [Bacteroidales bacterium]|nr:hypothetical protein [Bacteroidales bacterium]